MYKIHSLDSQRIYPTGAPSDWREGPRFQSMHPKRFTQVPFRMILQSQQPQGHYSLFISCVPSSEDRDNNVPLLLTRQHLLNTNHIVCPFSVLWVTPAIWSRKIYPLCNLWGWHFLWRSSVYEVVCVCVCIYLIWTDGARRLFMRSPVITIYPVPNVMVTLPIVDILL